MANIESGGHHQTRVFGSDFGSRFTIPQSRTAGSGQLCKSINLTTRE